MHRRKYTFSLTIIIVLLITLASGCSIAQSDAQELAEDAGRGENTPPGHTVREASQEDVDGPGGLTPLGPEQDPLFNFYNVPADWPRVVPLMSEFQVTDYEWSDEEMYAAGYGNVSMSRANNFYTNAQKEHVSSNIWEQDPDTPSVNEGTRQVFNYIGEGNTLSVILIESSDSSLYFELYFRRALLA